MAIIGLGISGCVLARALAEQGYRVHGYEARDCVGGMAYAGSMSFSITDERTEKFLYDRMSYRKLDNGLYAPLLNWRRSCEELLFHPTIHYLACAPITDVTYFLSRYDCIFSTASPDTLFQHQRGRLLYDRSGLPVRTHHAVTLYESYVTQLRSLGVYSLGYHGLYQRLSIEQCILQALELADLMTLHVTELPHTHVETQAERTEKLSRTETQLMAAPRDEHWHIYRQGNTMSERQREEEKWIL